MSTFDYIRKLVSNSKDNRRNTGRVEEDGLWTDIGPVMDMSAGGMRLLCNRKLRGSRKLALCSTDGRVDVTARVAWTKRRGIFKFDIGMQFTDMDEETRQKLSRIALAHGYPVSN